MLITHFIFKDPATTEIYTLSLHDALPIFLKAVRKFDPDQGVKFISYAVWWVRQAVLKALAEQTRSDQDRKSTRLNSSHLVISYAVFCLKKKKKEINTAG